MTNYRGTGACAACRLYCETFLSLVIIFAIRVCSAGRDWLVCTRRACYIPGLGARERRCVMDLRLREINCFVGGVWCACMHGYGWTRINPNAFIEITAYKKIKSE